jgi:signal transduction histidine kinase
VPLAARGRVLGVLLCGQFGADRPYGDDDLQFAEELARRAALAVDNARLYDAARQARDEAEQARHRADLARRAAEDANVAKANFLATMSHELRTPLSAIIGFSELLTDGISGPVTEAQQWQLQRITASARHLLALIEDILAFARVDPGRDDVVAHDRIDLRALARDTAALVEPIATTHGLALDVHATDGGPWARSDARKLRQILLNLLGNAVRYSERGTIRLTVAAGEGDATITVADQGIGISPQHLERIFDAFWQVDQNHTRRVGGTGLGLSISRRLAELLGGALRVESAVGVGSTFTLRIPLVRPADGADAPP